MLTAEEAGKLEASDEVHLEHARRDGRVIFTQDTDFLRLHAAGEPHCGIVYAPQGTDIGILIRGLMLIHDLLEPHQMEGHVEYI